MKASSDAARDYSRAHGDRFQQELFEMLRIPSLSGDPAHAGDIRRMAEWLAAHMQALGLDKTSHVMETAGHPVVYGEWLGAGPDKPTVLVYGHYDVVPAEMEDGWDDDPFEPVVKDGKHLRPRRHRRQGPALHPRQGAGILSAKPSGAARRSTSSSCSKAKKRSRRPTCVPSIEAHLDLLKADVCVISDSSMRASMSRPSPTACAA